MEKKQEMEWAEAQEIVISEDLVASAKQQLRFLAEVDRRRFLYKGSALEPAIYRYKYCWLPLLAQHAESQVPAVPLVVPLDCEWIWHCHRLNPVRYLRDCQELYGKILSNQIVVSSTQDTCRKKTEEIWKSMYPNEPYELNMNTKVPENVRKDSYGESTNYDLVSAVKRQSSFYYQVSSPHMNDDIFLGEAVARYKGFLHLIKRNKEMSVRRFCVPTYDIDLIWHSHQLHPASYCKDLMAITGKVLEHDDTDSDRAKGEKLDMGFSGTTQQWEETFGSRYWKAGALNRGSPPSPLEFNFHEPETSSKKFSSNEHQTTIQLPARKLCQVMTEIVGVRNLPDGHEGSLFLTMSKKKPDMFYCSRRWSITFKTREKQSTVFECEPTGDLICELVSYSCSVPSVSRKAKILGTVSIPLQDLMEPGSPLSTEKWFHLVEDSGVAGSKPISLRIAISFTPLVQAPFLLHTVQKQEKFWTCIMDDIGNEIINLQMRNSTRGEAKGNYLYKREVIEMISSGETLVLGEFSGTGWSLMNSSWFFQLHKPFDGINHVYELTGSQQVIIFPGRRLEYETTNCEKQKSEQKNFMTAIKFSAEFPYGKALALFDLKSGILKISEAWLLLPGILLAFILSTSHNDLTTIAESKKEMVHDSNQDASQVTESHIDHLTAKSRCCGAMSVAEELAQKNVNGTNDSICTGDCGIGSEAIYHNKANISTAYPFGSSDTNCSQGYKEINGQHGGGGCGGCGGGGCGAGGRDGGGCGGCGGGCGGGCHGGGSCGGCRGGGGGCNSQCNNKAGIDAEDTQTN